MKPAVVLVSFGSRETERNEAFVRLAGEVRARRPGWRVESAFLDSGRPLLLEVLQDLLAAGAAPIAVLPCFLFPGGHVEEDLANTVAEASARRPGAVIRVAKPLGDHEATPDILADEVPVEALETPRSVVVLIAAGSVALANRDAVERLAGVVRMRTGLAVRYAYLDQGEPLLAAVMSEVLAARPPFVSVLPCLVFGGLFMRDLSRAIEGWRTSYGGVKIYLGKPLADDPRLAAIIEAEAQRLLS
ncbi:MAG: CbiX/SirB N-terminal domain-containing protein [Candidatus Coatesbacteria bacterium]